MRDAVPARFSCCMGGLLGVVALRVMPFARSLSEIRVHWDENQRTGISSKAIGAIKRIDCMTSGRRWQKMQDLSLLPI